MHRRIVMYVVIIYSAHCSKWANGTDPSLEVPIDIRAKLVEPADFQLSYEYGGVLTLPLTDDDRGEGRGC